MTRAIMFVLWALTAANAALANTELRLGEPIHGGSGCPAGSAAVVLSEDQQSLTLLFDRYDLAAGGLTGKRFDRKNCSIAIPVHVPQGMSISVVAMDFRGYWALPEGGRGTFNIESFFAGERGPRATRSVNGEVNGELLLRHELASENLIWSACGADTLLRTNTSMLIQTNAWNEDAIATIDSADITAGIVYQIQWRHCE